METFINNVEDMQWLKDVHVHNMPDTARSAVITGNEDAPDSIAVYDSVEPLYTDVPILMIGDTWEHYFTQIAR
jgi:hypothetical protein